MNREDLLFKYFENELNQVQEELLFEQLQVDPTLREEFNQQMRIMMIARQESTTISAPLESAEAIFSKLGINGHYYYSARRKDKFFKFIKSPKVKKAAIASLILFLSFNAAFFSYKFANDYIDNSTQSISVNKTNSNIPIVSSSEVSHSTQDKMSLTGPNENTSNFFSQLASNTIFTQINNANLSNAYKENLNRIIKKFQNREKELLSIISDLSRQNISNASLKKDGLDNSEIALLQEISSQLISSSNPVNNGFSNNKLINLHQSSPGNSFKPIGPDPVTWQNTFSNMFPKEKKYEVSVRRNTQTSVSPVISSTLVNNTQQNFEISAGYKFKPQQQVFLVTGNDNFPQSFSHTIDGQQYQQIQNPNLYYFGLGYKYSPSYLLNQTILLPYASGFLSGTSVGPYMKIQSGLEFNLIRSLSLFAGIENGILIYNVDNKIYSTNKLNFVYGMNIRF